MRRPTGAHRSIHSPAEPPHTHRLLLPGPATRVPANDGDEARGERRRVGGQEDEGPAVGGERLHGGHRRVHHRLRRWQGRGLGQGRRRGWACHDGPALQGQDGPPRHGGRQRHQVSGDPCAHAAQHRRRVRPRAAAFAPPPAPSPPPPTAPRCAALRRAAPRRAVGTSSIDGARLAG
jgi:hypothetical protein